jgi:hypothetical protein
MFPLSEKQLSLLKIADFWAREIDPGASKKELLALLESAWWLGEITGNSALTRLQYLCNMFNSREHPAWQAVVFTTQYDDGPEASFPLASGGVVVDIRPRINVPGDTDSWTEDSCQTAFKTLATLPSYEHFPLLSSGLPFIELTVEEFFGWIEKRGFDPPKFWKRIATVDVAQASESSINLRATSTFPFSGKGAKKRAVQWAFKSLISSGVIPPGMTSQQRNDRILAKLRDEGHKSLPDKRTIERAIKDLNEG